MAKREYILQGDFDELLRVIDNGVIGGSVSASYEHGSDWQGSAARCAVRVYERYSAVGGNRVSLSVTVAGEGDELFVSAISSGGSQAIFFKFNTFGEEAFLGKLDDAIRQFERRQGR